jgi:hypothetical protein
MASAAPSSYENSFPGKKLTPVLPFTTTSALALEMQAAVSTIALPHRPLSTSLCRPITTLRAYKLPHSTRASSDGEPMIPSFPSGSSPGSCLRENAKVCAYRSQSRCGGGGGGGIIASSEGGVGQLPKKSKAVMWNLSDGALTVARIVPETNADVVSPKANADSRVDDNLLDSLQSVQCSAPSCYVTCMLHSALLV